MLPGGHQLTTVELFGGAGGLAIGMSNAGFSHRAVIERDRETCLTLRENHGRGVKPIADWPIRQADVRNIRYSEIADTVDVIAGGPPCQPFSICGKHRGHHDARDMFPEAVRAVRELRPCAYVFENVKGLLRESFATYFSYVLLQLTHPEITRKPDERWEDHRARLERHHTSDGQSDLQYKPVFQLVNAADYGVPQRRERVIIVGFRADIDAQWSFPEPTHSQNRLMWDQWVSGEYWERHNLPRPAIPPRLESRVQDVRSALPDLFERPWTTVRDAVRDLPDPEEWPHEDPVLNHRYMPGARPYPGHTGSRLDEPAKTLKAGDHGVPGGENMLVKDAGGVRYFTVRESARLQTFPDDYYFPRSWTESMRQIGNAVPVALAEAVASSVACALTSLVGRQ